MKRLLLIGAGHAHAEVMRNWIARPIEGVELTLLSPSALAPYSGMVPGWLAGVYSYSEICIDFAELARRAGARLVIDTIAGLDPERRLVRLASGPLLGYDVLSLNVGSTLYPEPVAQGRVLALRPLGELRKAWEALLPEYAGRGGTFTVSAAGGGPAGVEAILAVVARLRAIAPECDIRGRLVTRGARVLVNLSPGAAHAARKALAAAGIEVETGAAFPGRDPRPSDLILWAAGAQAHAWQRDAGLAVSQRGFIRIDRQLRSLSHREVYAVGDCAEPPEALPKAGVFAVRMGPVLCRNLRAALGAATPVEYRPQRRVLAILATADGSAIASWGRWFFARGRWVWRWKHWLDRSFIDRYSADRLPPRGPAVRATLARNTPE